MTYLAGTFPTTGTTRAGMKSVITAALTGAGWENLGDFADPDYTQYVTGQIYYRAFRSTAANSGMPRDLYVTIHWYDALSNDATTGDQTLYFTLTHDLDMTKASAKTGPNVAYYSKSDANGYQVIPSTDGTFRIRNFSSPSISAANGTQYFISVTPKRFVISTRSASNTVSSLHVGYFTNLFPATIANADTPAWSGIFDTQPRNYGDGFGSFLREPGAQMTAESRQGFGSIFLWAASVPTFDNRYYGGYVGLRPYLCHYRDGMPAVRGYIDGLTVFSDPYNLGSGTPNLGDSITVGGTKYVCFRPGASYGSAHWFIDTTV